MVVSFSHFSSTPIDMTDDREIAIILCDDLVRSYLINYARPLIYTTFMSFPSLAAIRASYSLLQSGATVQVSR